MFTLFRWIIVVCILSATPGVRAGSLKVTLAPSEAAKAGAQWRVANGRWLASGETATNVVDAYHRIELKDIPGWCAPPVFTVQVNGQKTATATATYIQAATLSVQLTPDGGQWRFNDGPWNASGVTIEDIRPGSHRLSFLAADGSVKPSDETIVLKPGEALSLTRSFSVAATAPPRPVLHTGSLCVTIHPPAAVEAGGRWRLDGGEWLESGSMVGDLANAFHLVQLKSIPGWMPAPGSAVEVGATAATHTATYLQAARLTVTLDPSHARWRLDGTTWRASGDTEETVAPQAHQLSFEAPEGFAPLAQEQLDPTPGQDLVIRRSFVPAASIRVDLSHAYGKWSLDGGAWNRSGATVTNAPAGPHRILYSFLQGMEGLRIEPELIDLKPHETTTLYREYRPAPFTISMTLVPGHGKYRVNGGAWVASGKPCAVPAGRCVVEYSPLPGLDTPPNSTFDGSPGGSAGGTVYYGKYTQRQSTLQIHLTPAMGRWSANGGPWISSGSQYNLDHGAALTIQYEPIPGYLAPPDETVAVPPEKTVTLRRTYLPDPETTTSRAAP